MGPTWRNLRSASRWVACKQAGWADRASISSGLKEPTGGSIYIGAILAAIDRKIDLHHRKQAVIEELLKALLEKLMTGDMQIGELDLSGIQVK